MEEQEYPSYVLATKRLTTDLVPATIATKHKRQESGPLDVAFVDTKDERKWYPICYCCVEQQPGGYKKCPNVTKAVGEQAIKAVDAGHFD